jgi:hypothetical protein
MCPSACKHLLTHVSECFRPYASVAERALPGSTSFVARRVHVPARRADLQADGALGRVVGGGRLADQRPLDPRRRGTDMLRYGEQLPAIMQAERWKTASMVARYTAKQRGPAIAPPPASPIGDAGLAAIAFRQMT